MCYYGVSDIETQLRIEVVDPAMERVHLDTNDLVRRYLSGESEYALAHSLSVSRGAIRLRLNGAGVTIRGWSAAGLVRASKMSFEERDAQAAAAHVATTGRKRTFESKCLSANTRQERGLFISSLERDIAAMLEARGFEPVLQQAVGPYNCDIAIYPVAVEVFGGAWHWYGDHMLRTPERFRYILNAGWHILAVTTYRRTPVTGETADYIAAYIEEMRRDPARRREYRVIRGAGELMASGSAEDDHISIMPTFTSSRDSLGRYVAVPR